MVGYRRMVRGGVNRIYGCRNVRAAQCPDELGFRYITYRPCSMTKERLGEETGTSLATAVLKGVWRCCAVQMAYPGSAHLATRRDR